jgi:hypothetical protein
MMLVRQNLALLILLALCSPSLAQGKSEYAPGHGGTPPGQGGTPPGQVDRDNSGKSVSGSNLATPAPSNAASVTPTPAAISGNTSSSNRTATPSAFSSSSDSSAGAGAGATSSALLSAAPAATSEPARQPVAIIDTLSADQVRSAVESRQALPLSSFSDAIRQRGGGDMVDANLLRVDNMLVYAIKVLNPAGRLTIEYFHARSGVYIGSE